MSLFTSEMPGSLATATPSPPPATDATSTALPYYSPAPGQPFEPYTGPLSEKDFKAPPVNRKWETTKIVLHCMGILFSLAGFAMTGVLLAPWSLLYTHKVVTINYAALAPTLIWDTAELVTRAVRKWKAGIHPGAHVGISLIISLICWAFSFTIGGLEFPTPSMQEQCGGYALAPGNDRLDTSDWEYQDCVKDARLMNSFGLALAIFILLCGVVHFILFVGACVDTNIRNRTAKRPRIIMVMNPQLAMQGWQPVPAAVGPALPSEISEINEMPNELPTIVEAIEKDSSGAPDEFNAQAHHAV